MMIETFDLKKKFGEKTILNGINIHVKEGEIYGFVGRNGAGKTTLMKILCGLIPSTEGSFRLLGMDDVNEARKKIGCLIEDPAIYQHLTAEENIRYYAKLKGVEKTVNPANLLELVGLKNVEGKKAGAFSLGMKQRLSIAVALVNDPKLLILDEPINGLDPQGIVEVRETLMKLADEGRTIFISSHIMGELGRLATSYGIISNGVVVEEFTAQELENRVSRCIHVKTDNDADAMKAVSEKFGIAKIQRHSQEGFEICEKLELAAEINRFLNESGYMVSQIHVSGTDAEEYFLARMQ